jgi:hypothetical protein
MAVKLMGVGGRKILEGEEDERTQDFVLMDHPAFSRDTRSNRGLAEAILRSMRPSLLKSLLFWIRVESAKRAAYIAVDYFILGFRFHEFKPLRDAVSKKPASPLGIIYWSATPYQLGPMAVKYSARPLPSDVPVPTDMTSPNRLRQAMADHLARSEARFDFMVQVRTSVATMPVEDSSIIWSESESPFRKVASIVIPHQTFDTPEQMTFCENLSNNP